MKKKNIVCINSTVGGSTGRIMNEIAEGVRKEGYIVYTASAVHGNETRVESPFHLYIGTKFGKRVHLTLAKLFCMNGMFSVFDTFMFCRRLNAVKPDLIHLHNLHNCYINIPMLMKYIAKRNIPVLWTLHDCWAFTGHCPYFDRVNCQKWKAHCESCPQYRGYPYSAIDRVNKMYKKKKKWFSISQIQTLVTPSKWLKDLVDESFLSIHTSKVINNGIDLCAFRPTESTLREELGIGSKAVILGVANAWEDRKGYSDFLELNACLGKDYQIILIGLKDKGEEDGIIRIGRTDSREQLAAYYSMADVFVNPTKEDNYPTVNIEALACGTPVITYKTGGSPESISDGVGSVVEQGNIEALQAEIVNYCSKEKPSALCVQRASRFSKENEIKEYFSEYKRLLNGIEK